MKTQTLSVHLWIDRVSLYFAQSMVHIILNLLCYINNSSIPEIIPYNYAYIIKLKTLRCMNTSNLVYTTLMDSPST